MTRIMKIIYMMCLLKYRIEPYGMVWFHSIYIYILLLLTNIFILLPWCLYLGLWYLHKGCFFLC